ncbi:substrate-binding domain-containing protein [Microbacterium sp.]|uniref:sugar ABC transporter substrate-binding protein n=1 Tax=Microbacterium sp. TaxID=51671 RepID=UPI003221DF76
MSFTPRSVLVVGGLLAATALVAGCSGGSTVEPSASGDAAVTIAAVLPNTSDPFWQTMSCGIDSRAAELGVEVQQFNSTNTDANAVASNFQSASLIGADGMIVTPLNNNQFVAQFQKLMGEGVPIVTGNGTEPQVNYLTINSGNDTAGFAEDVADVIPAGAGSMVFLGGAPGIPPLENRTQPFVEAVQAMRPDLTALPTDYSGFDINKATSNVASLIIANPDLKLIIAADGPDGVGAAAAVKQAGKAGEIAVIAFDAVPAQVEALREGTISVLIAQDPFSIGADSVQAIVDYLAEHADGGAVEPAGAKGIQSAVLTADNIDDPSNEKYLYTTECG